MSTPDPVFVPLAWHDEAELLGVRVRAFFFDPAEADARHDFVGRQLPILQGLGPRLLTVEGQRSSYQAGALLAQPDAVLSHGDGLLCLAYKGGDGRRHEPDRWRGQCRADLMLQCIASAMAVAGQCQQPTAALWRGANLLCQFDPGVAVLDMLASHIAAARAYWRETGPVSPAQLAAFCEPRLRMLPGLGAPGSVSASLRTEAWDGSAA